MQAAEKANYERIVLFPGIAIYRIGKNSNWFVRVRDTESGVYRVKSTGNSSSIKAKAIAKQYAVELRNAERSVPREYQFTHFALELLKTETLRVSKGERSIGSLKAMRWCIENARWGMLDRFGRRDIRTISTGDFVQYMRFVDEQNPDWAPSNKNTILATFRNVLKCARDTGAIISLPETPRSKQRDNPRPFFRFFPLVPEKDDQLQILLRTARQMAQEGVAVRWISVTDELPDILLFIINCFVRPISSELYALRHRDITIAENPPRLVLTIRDCPLRRSRPGKTE
jgi:hypothetical protein